jgi:hypothetical protein
MNVVAKLQEVCQNDEQIKQQLRETNHILQTSSKDLTSVPFSEVEAAAHTADNVRQLSIAL